MGSSSRRVRILCKPFYRWAWCYVRFETPSSLCRPVGRSCISCTQDWKPIGHGNLLWTGRGHHRPCRTQREVLQVCGRCGRHECSNAHNLFGYPSLQTFSRHIFRNRRCGYAELSTPVFLMSHLGGTVQVGTGLVVSWKCNKHCIDTKPDDKRQTGVIPHSKMTDV